MNENKFDFHQIDCNKQFNFYQDIIEDVDYKMAVIISDAFRYELGFELYNDLLADSKNNLTIQHCLASVPSYTNLGMSNLLPNKGITVGQANGKFAGRKLGAVQSEEKLLQRHQIVLKKIQKGLTIREINEITGASSATIIKVKKVMVSRKLI